VKAATKQQRRLYWALVNRLREVAEFDEDSRRAVTGRVCGVQSTKALPRADMKRLIAEIRRLCEAHHVRLPRRRDPWRPSPGIRPTKKQTAWVAELERRLGWAGEPGRLQGFIRRTFRGFRSNLEDLTRREMSVLITALEAERNSQVAGKAQMERPDRASHAEAPDSPQFRYIAGGIPT